MAGRSSSRFTLFPGQARSEARYLSFSDRESIAHDVAAEARSNAPILTGDYRDGISVLVEGMNVSIVDTDDNAIWKEYGTIDTPAHAALTDAARNAPGKYTGWMPDGSAGSSGSGGGGGSNLVPYTTAAGNVRMVTPAQRDYFNRGR